MCWFLIDCCWTKAKKRTRQRRACRRWATGRSLQWIFHTTRATFNANQTSTTGTSRVCRQSTRRCCRRSAMSATSTTSSTGRAPMWSRRPHRASYLRPKETTNYGVTRSWTSASTSTRESTRISIERATVSTHRYSSHRRTKAAVTKSAVTRSHTGLESPKSH